MNTSSRLIAVALLAVLATGVRAQAPAAAPKRIYTKRMAFKLPLRIDDKERAQLREVQLYVKNGPGGTWQAQDKAPPTQADFTYRVAQDGEYWFSVVTVDRSGKQTPADVGKEPPGVIVVVDTQPPEIDIRPMMVVQGDSFLQCTIHDANPDYGKLKVECQGMDKNWQTLDTVPDQPGVFRMITAAAQGVVRATATDRAGNTASREITLASATSQLPSETAGSIAAPPIHPDQMDNHFDKPDNHAFKSEMTAHPESGTEHGPTAFDRGDSTADKSAPVQGGSMMSNLQLINGTHASLDYQIDEKKLGANDRIEVWATCDDGQTWQRLSEDKDRHSPAEFDLPGEGVFGLSLVVSNGSISQPPAKGEAPASVVEVDITRPVAQLTGVHPAAGEGAGRYVITWTASDKNLKAEPIDLLYSTHRQGPWEPIAKALRNDGSYRWQVPADKGPELYVRMEVSDRAGNVTHCDAPEPIVSNVNRPRPIVTGIKVKPAKAVPSALDLPTPPSGN